MNSPLAWIALAAVLAAAVGVYVWRGTDPAPAPVATAPATPGAPPGSAPPAEPQVLHPVPPPPPGAPPLPALAESDTAANEAVAALVGRDAFARMFFPDGLVRRFVATIDNLPRPTASVRVMPVRPVPGAYAVAPVSGGFTASADNALRYRPYVLALEAAEAKRLVATYVRLYPLFDTAYRELGYPNGHFNDRLVVAIDDLLAAPDVDAAVLAQPKVLYVYADPILEARSAGQKIMMRMGTANAARVKDKLRAIRRELTGSGAPS